MDFISKKAAVFY